MDRESIREAYESKKKKEKSERTPLKDWISIPLSILAFAVSGLTAYYNVIERSDHVGLIPSFSASVSRGAQVLEVTAPEHEAIFINSGNQTAVITDMNLVVLVEKECQRDAQRLVTGSGVNLRTNFTPTVVKPRDVAFAKIEIGEIVPGPKFAEKTGNKISIPLEDSQKAKDSLSIQFCWLVNLATPAKAFHSSSALIGTLRLDRAGKSHIDEDDALLKPRVLIREFSTVFTY